MVTKNESSVAEGREYHNAIDRSTRPLHSPVRFAGTLILSVLAAMMVIVLWAGGAYKRSLRGFRNMSQMTTTDHAGSNAGDTDAEPIQSHCV